MHMLRQTIDLNKSGSLRVAAALPTLPKGTPGDKGIYTGITKVVMGQGRQQRGVIHSTTDLCPSLTAQRVKEHLFLHTAMLH